MVRKGGLADLFVQKVHGVILPAECSKGRLFAQEGFHGGGKNAVFRFFHGHHIIIGEVQQAFQGQLFINGVCSVNGSAVCTLYAGNTVCQILFERVPAQDAEIVEPYIGGQLEFQYCTGFPQIFNQLFSSQGFKVGGIEAVTDPHGRHGLTGQKRFLHTAQTFRHVVFEGIIFSCMDADDKARIVTCDGDQFMDQRTQIPYIIDFFTDDIGSCHIGIAGDCPQGTNLVLDHTLRLHLVTDNGQGDPSEGGEQAEYHPCLPGDGGHGFVELSQE